MGFSRYDSKLHKWYTYENGGSHEFDKRKLFLIFTSNNRGSYIAIASGAKKKPECDYVILNYSAK
jgi:hypothetical protein